MLGHRPASRLTLSRPHATPNHLIRVLPVLIVAAVLAIGCSGGSKKKASPTAQTAPATPAAVAQVASSTPAPAPATVAPSPTAVRVFTPLPVTPPPTPTPAPTPVIRTENGLQIQDLQFLGKITASGGVRIRSAPDAAATNVVGSVPEGALVTVEGKVLNGSEAEAGKGTVWYIVGPKQYIYGAEGYVQRLDATPAR